MSELIDLPVTVEMSPTGEWYALVGADGSMRVTPPLDYSKLEVGYNVPVEPTQEEKQRVIQQPGRINIRNKGQRGEREVVKLLQSVVDVVRARRGLSALAVQRNTLQSDQGGHDLAGLGPFSVEVKWQETPYNDAWWRQCLAQAGGSMIPILFYRQTRQPWKVKFRCFVNTPNDRDQIEMDATVGIEDFIEWFGDAYDEHLALTYL
jgi:hypothetical protein